MYGRNVSGTIKLPKEGTDLEKLRVWAHGSYEGNIAKESKDTVTLCFIFTSLQYHIW